MFQLRDQLTARLWKFSDRIVKKRTIDVVTTQKTTKFVVKLNRSGARFPEYVKRIDRLPIQTTTNRKLALVMGRFTAEEAVTRLTTTRCSPELISVRVNAQVVLSPAV